MPDLFGAIFVLSAFALFLFEAAFIFIKPFIAGGNVFEKTIHLMVKSVFNFSRFSGSCFKLFRAADFYGVFALKIK